jgi:PAS domain S-box-containing protein
MAGKKSPMRATPAPSSAQNKEKEMELACQALQELKRELTQIARIGGGQTSEGLLLAAADNCPDAVLVTNDQAQIRMVNGAAARLVGLSTRELQSLSVWDITHAGWQGDFDVLWKEFLRSGRQRGHYALRHKDGSAVEVAYCLEANVLPHQHVSVMRKP